MGVGVTVGVIVGVLVGVAVGVTVGVSVGLLVGVSVGVLVGVALGVLVGLLVGVFVGVLVGVAVGVSVGVFVGLSVGVVVGVFVGELVGVCVGVSVGVAVGELVGVLVGVSVGVLVGVSVGVFVGVLVGVCVGVFVGQGSDDPSSCPQPSHTPSSPKYGSFDCANALTVMSKMQTTIKLIENLPKMESNEMLSSELFRESSLRVYRSVVCSPELVDSEYTNPVSPEECDTTSQHLSGGRVRPFCSSISKVGIGWGRLNI